MSNIVLRPIDAWDRPVAVQFKSHKGPLKFYCDAFDQWQDNLRAIALTLEHLRTMDRYGCTSGTEQYTGFAALPAPESNGFKDAQDAATWMFTQAGSGGSTSNWQENYRICAKKFHPDLGGDVNLFKKLQDAKRLLEA